VSEWVRAGSWSGGVDAMSCRTSVAVSVMSSKVRL
jgi:hypothetical protein